MCLAADACYGPGTNVIYSLRYTAQNNSQPLFSYRPNSAHGQENSNLVGQITVHFQWGSQCWSVTTILRSFNYV